jgi:prepilin peptidase CpaA
MDYMFILLIVLAIAAITDVRTRRIPNWLTYPTMGVGLLYHVYADGWQGFLFGLEGLSLGFALLVVFYLLGGMGAGDVKLMAGVGSILGPKIVLVAFVFTALTGGIYAIIILMIYGKLKDYFLTIKTLILTRKLIFVPAQNTEKLPALYYGVAIAVGTCITMILYRYTNFI